MSQSSGGLKAGAWHVGFARCVHELRTEAAPKKKVRALSTIEKAIKFDVFLYDNREAEMEGKKALLSLWEFFLDELSALGGGTQQADGLSVKNLSSSSSSSASLGNQKQEKEKSGILSQTQLYKHAFDCIPFLTRRYEFDLIHYFRPAEIGLYNLPSHLSLDETKALLKTYKSMLTRTLKVCFHQLSEGTIEKLGNDPSLGSDIHIFCMRMLALCFFRQPLLCGPLMQTISQCARMGEATDENFPGMAPGRPKPEWLMSVDRELNSFLASVEKNNRVVNVEGQKMSSSFLLANPSFFEWTCPKIFDDVSLLQQETTILAQAISVLSVRFVERGLFFGLIFTWLHHITRLVHGCLLWNCIPGYFVIVTAFFNRILQNCALLMDQKVLDCLAIISKNKQLSPVLGYFSQILLHTTNIYNKSHFNTAFDILDIWMNAADGTVTDYYSEISEEATTMSTRLPETFASDSFFLAIKLALSYDHFQVLLKTLTLLYMHLGRFYGEKRRKLLDLLFEPELFFSLLLHWHPEVRQVFCYVLVYRLQRAGLPPLDLRTSESTGSQTPPRRSSMSCMSSSLLASLSLSEGVSSFGSDDDEEEAKSFASSSTSTSSTTLPSSSSSSSLPLIVSPGLKAMQETKKEMVEEEKTSGSVKITPPPNIRRSPKLDPDTEIGGGGRMSVSRRMKPLDLDDHSHSNKSAVPRRSSKLDEEVKIPSSPRMQEGSEVGKAPGRMGKLRRSLSSFFKAADGEIIEPDIIPPPLSPRASMDRRHLLESSDPSFESCQLVYTILDEFEQETDAMYAERLRDRLELLHSEVRQSTGAIQGLLYAPKAMVKLEQSSQTYRRLQQVFDNKLDGDFRLKFLLSHKRSSSNNSSTSPTSLARQSSLPISTSSTSSASSSSSTSECSSDSASTSSALASSPPFPSANGSISLENSILSILSVPSRVSSPPPPPPLPHTRASDRSASTHFGSRSQQWFRGAGVSIRGQIFIPSLFFQISEAKM